MYSGPIIDPHIHLWDLSMKKHAWLLPSDGAVQALGGLDKLRQDFGVEDYLHDAANQPVEAAVHIEALWDRSDLERLYARLEDEYELKERANALQHKLQVIEGTSRALVDIIDTERSSRLEATIVLLIVVEVLIAFYELFFRLTR